MNKDIIELYKKYETELQVTLPEFSQELSELIFQYTTAKPAINTNKSVQQNNSPHFTCDFAEPISRHSQTKQNTRAIEIERCPNCFEVHSLKLRNCTICNERHDGCCEIIVT